MKQGKSGFDIERAGIVVGMLGFLLLVAGVACIYWPAGLVIAGLLLLAWSAMAARAAAMTARQNKDAG
jgi:hypothetical protein